MNNIEKSLHEACAAGNIEAAKTALSSGAGINSKGEYGDTALNIAARNGHLDIAKLLLTQGADIENKGGADMTPMMNASVDGHWDIVQLLVEKGALVTNELLSIIAMKVNILQENAESGMVVEEALEAWKRFQSYLRKMRLKQDLPEIFKALSSLDADLKNRALESLEAAANYGFDLSPAISELKKIIEAEDIDAAATAAVALTAYFIHNKNWKEISLLCKNTQTNILLSIMSAFVSFSKAGFDLTPLMPEVLLFLQHSSEDLRHDASIVAGYLATNGFESKGAVPALTQILHENEPSMRKIAAWAFYRMAKYGKVDLSSALSRLKELESDENEEVQNLAVEVITALENQNQEDSHPEIPEL